MEKINYVQVVEQTDEEKFKMYMDCTKEELAKMLMQANKIINMLAGNSKSVDVGESSCSSSWMTSSTEDI